MPLRHPFITYTLVLVLLALGTATAKAQSSEEDAYISIKYRTFGWGLQKTLSTSNGKKIVSILDTQFSGQQTYTGPRIIRFYKSDEEGIDEWQTGDPADEIEPDAKTQKTTTPMPQAEVTIPIGAKEVLLIFIPAPEGSKLPLQAIALDDSLSQIDNRNVHFYNLSDIELIVKTFDKVKKIAPFQQSRWDLKPQENKSFIAIAVTNPEAKLVYSTRYRLRDGQRIVFFARKQPGNNPDGTPKLLITSLLNKIEKELMPPLLMDDKAIEKEMESGIY